MLHFPLCAISQGFSVAYQFLEYRNEQSCMQFSGLRYGKEHPLGFLLVTPFSDSLQWPCMYSVQFSSVAQSCPTLCNSMNRSTAGLPVHHQLPEFTQTHVHRVSDAIQPSHPLLSPSPPALNQGLSNESTLRMRWPKYWSFSFSISPSNEHPGLISFRMDWLDLLAVSRVFSNTTVQKHQFFGAQPSSQCNSHIHTDHW